MVRSGDVLEMEPLGLCLKFVRTAEDTGGELVEMEVSGHPRGFLAQRHIHPTQTERLEVLAGAMKVTMHGHEHILREGESIEIPPGTAHTQEPVGGGDGTVRIQARPAGCTQAFMERVAELCREGKFLRSGYPRPLAGAELVLDYAAAGYASAPPPRVQQALARALVGLAKPMRPYLFVDEWDVAAPAEAVFNAIADSRTYPEWWAPVYLEVQADGPPEVGGAAHHHFKGRLPYHLHTTSVIAAIDAPRTVTADVDGDLRGRGVWTLTPTATGTRVRFDWQVHADRKLLKALTPVLRPLFRWNHNWAIARAQAGLEPYATRTASRLVSVG